MKIELTIPTSLDEIPLMHYQKFMEVSKNSNDDEFTAQKMIQIFCGIELKEVVKIAFNDMVDLVNHFNKLFSEIPKLKPTFKIKDLELGMIPNFDKITWEEYIELESQFKEFDTFHKAMAVLYRPVIEKNKKNQYLIAPFNNVEEFSDLMKYTPLSVALSSHVFFWNLEKELLEATLNYLEKQMMKLNKNSKMILAKKISSVNNGDGIKAFMQSQKEILQNLMKSSEQNYLPSLTF